MEMGHKILSKIGDEGMRVLFLAVWCSQQSENFTVHKKELEMFDKI